MSCLSNDDRACHRLAIGWPSAGRRLAAGPARDHAWWWGGVLGGLLGTRRVGDGVVVSY
jgi:hypothetical protein